MTSPPSCVGAACGGCSHQAERISRPAPDVWCGGVLQSSTNFPRVMTEAVRCAATHSRIEALRYLTADDTAVGRFGRCVVGRDLLVDAAKAGHVPIFAHLHRISTSKEGAASCPCTRRVGNAAWKAPKIDVALWMRGNGCKGYVQPDGHIIARAISLGRAADVARMTAARAGLRGMFAACGGPPVARPCDEMPEIQVEVAIAAGKGNMAMVELAVRSLCTDPTPILLGAAREGRTDLLSWATAPDGICVATLGAPTPATMQAVALAATACNQPKSLEWIAHHSPGAIAPYLLYKAAAAAAIDALRVLLGILPAPIPWSGVLMSAIKAGSIEVVRFLVEEKGVPLTPSLVIASRFGHEAVGDYVCGRLTRDQLQAVIDIIGACPETYRDYWLMVERIHRCAPGLCTAVASAMCIDSSSGYRKKDATPCACARCTGASLSVASDPQGLVIPPSPKGDGLPASTASSSDDDLPTLPPPAKRQRVEPSPPMNLSRERAQ